MPTPHRIPSFAGKTFKLQVKFGSRYLFEIGALVGPEHWASLLDERAVVDLLDEGAVLDLHDVGTAALVSRDWAVALLAEDGASG